MEKLLKMLAGVIEQNTRAMDRVCSAVEENAKMIKDNAAKNNELAAGMNRMVVTISAAQRKIGGELGGIIDKSKESARILHEEATAAVKARRTGG